MANSILSMLGGNNGGFNMLTFLSEFNKFKKSIQGKDPQAMLNELINSGKVSKEQYDQARLLAEKLSAIMKK